MKTFRIHRLPEHVEPDSLSESSVVVIDVLRATSTITTALHHGASTVIPCETIEDAHQAHRRLDGHCELCGERRGAKIEGFDRGNSPSEYINGLAKNVTLVFTTTNGTRAMLHARFAARILLASFLNLTAVVKKLQNHNRVDIVCSGTNRVPTLEDELLAGAIASRLCQYGYEYDVESEPIIQNWEAIRGLDSHPKDLISHLKRGQGGINLMKRGFEADIEFCSQIDIFDSVCQYDPNENRIHLS